MGRRGDRGAGDNAGAMAQAYALGTLGYEIVASVLLLGGLGWLVSLVLPVGRWGLVVGLVAGLVVGVARFIVRGLAYARRQEEERQARVRRDSDGR